MLKLRAAADNPLTVLFLPPAFLALSFALQVSDGHYSPPALWWLALVLVFSLLALLFPRFVRWQPPAWLVLTLLAVGLVWQLFALTQQEPGIYLTQPWPGGYTPFFVGVSLAGLLVLLGLIVDARWRWWWFLPLLLVHFALGAWVLRHSPNPTIDVFVFQQEATAALLHGTNPYTLTFPNIYGDQPYYGPGVTANGRVNFGFPYPPVSLLLALPGYLVAGDYRYAQLLALTLSGLLLALARPGKLPLLAAALLLFSPRVFFVLEQGWTEPLVVVLLALTVTCACRWPRWLPIALGLFVASKQTLIAVPLLALLLVGGVGHWRVWWRLLWRAAAVALVVTLPLALTALREFVYSVLLLQFYQPLRTDALSFVAVLTRHGFQVPGWLAFGVLVVVLVLVLWAGVPTPAGFASGIGVAYLCFFAFNKQAFCNYYFFTLAALAVGIAVTQPGGSGTPAPRSTIKAVNGSAVTVV